MKPLARDAGLVRQSADFWRRPEPHNRRALAGPGMDEIRARARRRRMAMWLRWLCGGWER